MINNNFSKFILALACFLLAGLAWAPIASADTDNDFGAWGAVQAQGSFVNSELEQNRWLWWMEGQVRLFNDASRFGQSIIRPGVGYKLSDHISIWSGYAWIYTSPLGKDDIDEHRIWQQLSWGDAYSWGNLATRTRLEQRFVSSGNDTGWRFRQLLKYTHPIISNRVYLSVWDEVFVNINNTDWGANSGFGQNRAFAGIGIFIDPKHQYRFEFGYLNQFINREKSTNQMNHVISASLFIRY